jgi:hypothetical protein
MNETHIAAAYGLYRHYGWSIRKLSIRFWRPFGYASPEACRSSLRYAFRCRGLPLHSRSTAMTLHHQKRRARTGTRTRL